MTNWENMTPEDEQRILDNASKLKGFFSPIRAAYGIPENVPIIEELDRRFERMEATIKELENKNIALEIFAKGATAIGGDQIERIQALEKMLWGLLKTEPDRHKESMSYFPPHSDGSCIWCEAQALLDALN